MTERGVKLRVECQGLMGKAGRVWLNDEEVSGSVCRVEVAWDVVDVTRATITYLVREIEVDSVVLETGGGGSAPPVHPLNPLSPHVRDPGPPAAPEPVPPPRPDFA